MSKNKASLTSGIGGNLQHPTGGEIEFVHTFMEFQGSVVLCTVSGGLWRLQF